jgi:hypothetical protein
MPTRALIIKIAMLAGDERAHPMVRQVAFDKLAGFKESHPHLFVLPAEAPELEDGQPMWADVPDAPDANSATPPPPPPWYGGKAWFMDIKNWDTTPRAIRASWSRPRASSAEWCCSVTSGRRLWGFLLINTHTDATTFSEQRYLTEIAAHEGAWKALCAI